jgi:DegV family protein with EDD domain
MDTRAFYDLQRRADTPPTTSAPQPGAFLGAFQQAAGQRNQIICLTLSQRLSAAYQSALLAKEEAARALPGVQVHVIDTRTAGPAEGLVALEAARLAATGASTETVLAAISRRLSTVCLMAYVQTLYYVWKGGRVPRVAMWLGNLLDVKPILELSKDQVRMMERPRTERRARERLVSLVAQRLGGATARIAVVHADAPQQAQELAEALRQAVAPVELFVTEFTPVIGAHTGPGLVGCAFHPVETDQ